MLLHVGKIDLLLTNCLESIQNVGVDPKDILLACPEFNKKQISKDFKINFFEIDSFIDEAKFNSKYSDYGSRKFSDIMSVKFDILIDMLD